MSYARITVRLTLGLSCVPAAFAAVETHSVTYYATQTLKGFLAYDRDLKHQRPGILIVHEWWGQNDYVRRRARMLAELGYTALAIDMYGEGRQADHPEEAGKFAAKVLQNLPLGKARFQAALDLLREHPTTDPRRIAAIGYCFGGAVVLQMARVGADLQAVVSFHGALSTEQPAQTGAVKARILVCHGAEDTLITQNHIEQFHKEMKTAGADYQFLIYPNARHSFTNPAADVYAQRFGLPLGYNAAADRQSWAEMLTFLENSFAVRSADPQAQ